MTVEPTHLAREQTRLESKGTRPERIPTWLKKKRLGCDLRGNRSRSSRKIPGIKVEVSLPSVANPRIRGERSQPALTKPDFRAEISLPTLINPAIWVQITLPTLIIPRFRGKISLHTLINPRICLQSRLHTLIKPENIVDGRELSSLHPKVAWAFTPEMQDFHGIAISRPFFGQSLRKVPDRSGFEHRSAALKEPLNQNRACASGNDFGHPLYARICFTTFPCTSVRRKSRPWNR
jgi:hypothetical protein